MNDIFQESKAYRALRKIAEQRLAYKGTKAPEDFDMMRMVNEIEVQQIELDVQNQELRGAFKELENSRNDYFELFDSAPVALVIVNPKGLIERFNQAAVHLLSGPPDFLTGRAFSTLVPREDQDAYHSFLKKHALGKGPRFCELRLLGRREKVVYVHLDAASKKDPQGHLSHWRFGMVDITKRIQFEQLLQKAHSELEQRSRQLARLATDLTLAEQRERRRMADILHDHLQQMLAGARLNLELASETKGPAHDQAIKDATHLVVQSLSTSRTLSAELSPPVLYMHGLCEALKWLARWMESAHKLHVNLHVDPQADPAQEELKVLLFQSVRELLFNTAKHAGTDNAKVLTQSQDDHIKITVSDQGKGFDPKSVLESRRQMENGYGLFNIRERLTLMGGSFDITSSQSGGTTVTLSAPLQVSVFDIPERRKAKVDHRHPPLEETTALHQRRPQDKIRVLLVDDHAVMRKGLSLLISRHKDIEIAGEAADGGQAIEQAQRINPDVVLMDISMPVMNGIEATRIIHSQLPHIRIIALSMHNEDEQADAMYKAGAVGFISKSGNPNSIISTIRQLSSGR